MEPQELNKACHFGFKWPHLAVESYSRGNSARFIKCTHGRDFDEVTPVF